MQGHQEYQPDLFVTVDLEKMIPSNHLLRKLDRLLDLSFIRAHTKDFYCDNNGRPSVDPELFVRMLLISYFYGIDSDRRLCEEIQFNFAYRWYCRLSLADRVPDHSSMTRIRDRLGETTFKKIFDHVVDLCREKGLIKGKQVMTDASLVKANAALDSLEKIGATEEEIKNRPAFQKGVKYSNKTHVSSSDPDATLANKTGVHKALYYKVHSSADMKSRVILDCQVTTGSTHDTVIFKERANEIIEENPQIREWVADRGYGSRENLEFLEDKDVKHFIPLWRPQVGEQEKGFSYDKKKDRFQCPEGHYLYPGALVDDIKRYSLSLKVCKLCPRFESCVTAAEKRNGRGKQLRRNINQPFFEKVRRRERTKLFRSRLRERMWSMEGLFAEAKNFHGLHRARYRRLSKVQIQVYMIASVQNLKRLAGAISTDLYIILRNLIFRVLKPAEVRIAEII